MPDADPAALVARLKPFAGAKLCRSSLDGMRTANVTTIGECFTTLFQMEGRDVPFIRKLLNFDENKFERE
jgi:hypothetical protein